MQLLCPEILEKIIISTISFPEKPNQTNKGTNSQDAGTERQVHHDVWSQCYILKTGWFKNSSWPILAYIIKKAILYVCT